MVAFTHPADAEETRIKSVLAIAKRMAGDRAISRSRIDWSFAANAVCDLPEDAAVEDVADRIIEELDRLKGWMA